MSTMEFKITGVDAVIRKLSVDAKTAIASIKKAMYAGMREFEKEIIVRQMSNKVISMYGLRVDTGTLRRSWGLPYEVNNADGFAIRLGTSTRYARIHQFGGTINHPGGTPYITLPDKSGDWKFIPLSKNKIFTPAYKDSTNARIRFTNPHNINMPKRLYIYESFQTSGMQMIRKKVDGAIALFK